MKSGGYRCVLFDLGGVLVRLQAVGPMSQLVGSSSDAEFWCRWLASRWVRDFERGRCSSSEFAAGIAAEWGMTASADSFLEAFENWPEALYDGALALVADVRRAVPVGCLSNSNPLHWNRFASLWHLDRLFDVRFLSHEMGLVKPDRELFEHVVGRLEAPPESIVFLDDNQANVTGAQEAGLTAVKVSGPSEARRELEKLGILSARLHERDNSLRLPLEGAQTRISPAI